MPDVAVGLKRVTKDFGEIVDLSLDVHENEFFSLLGPSGCGKTTTLGIIGGTSDPETEFVAGFLGASNLLDGELKEQRDGHTTVLLAGGNTVTLPSDRAPFSVGSQVRVGVRPEKITIASDDGSEPGPGWNSVTGLLRMSTYIGVSHQYKVGGPLGAPLTVWVQNLGTGPAPQPGDRVRLSWQWEHTFAVLPQEGLALEEEEE